MFCLKIFFTFTNSVNPDEMQHYAAFYLGLHCLPEYLFLVYKGLEYGVILLMCKHNYNIQKLSHRPEAMDKANLHLRSVLPVTLLLTQSKKRHI